MKRFEKQLEKMVVDLLMFLISVAVIGCAIIQIAHNIKPGL